MDKIKINEDECIGNLKKQFYRDTVEAQRNISVSASEAVGNMALAFWRGVQAGQESIKSEVESLREENQKLKNISKPDFNKDPIYRIEKTLRVEINQPSGSAVWNHIKSKYSVVVPEELAALRKESELIRSLFKDYRGGPGEQTWICQMIVTNIIKKEQ
jgi:hypothetical protein